MHSIVIAAIVFGCCVIGARLGMFLRGALPEHHLNSESKDVVKLATGLVASMAALVLGLLVASATGEFNTQKGGFQQLAANIILLDKTLERFGPEADAARDLLRGSVATFLDRYWPDDGTSPGLGASEITDEARALYTAIRELKPADDSQKASQAEAEQIYTDLGKTRFLLAQQDDPSIPRPFLVVLAFWLFALFTSFGLFAPRNPTVAIALFICALSVSGAIFLIVDLDQPFGGLIQISSEPMRDVLSQLGK